MIIACLQFAPIFRCVEESIDKVNGLLAAQQITGPGVVDVLVLPEMAFTGYTFLSVEDILPYAEDVENRINTKSCDWAVDTAKKLEAFVQVGFIRKEKDRLYNSIVFVSPDGEIVCVYDKHFLYTADESWALEGKGFHSMDLAPFGKLGFGICMDLNPYKFQAPFEAYEFAHFHRDAGSDFIFCSHAWLARPPGVIEIDENQGSEPEDTPDMAMIQYWAQRLSTLALQSNKRVIVAIANMNGTEDYDQHIEFCGSSVILQFEDRKVRILECATKSFEGVIFATV